MRVGRARGDAHDVVSPALPFPFASVSRWTGESGCRRMSTAGRPGPGAGLAGCVGSVEDFRASLESGNSSLFSPPSAARTPKVILRPLKQKHRPARH